MMNLEDFNFKSNDLAEKVISFWLNGPKNNISETTNLKCSAESISHVRQNLWFVKSNDFVYQKEVDNIIYSEFGKLLESVRKGELDKYWGGTTGTAREVTALVIILDQFSRHIYRHKPKIIQSCTLNAVLHTKNAISRGLDTHLVPSLLCFLLMPLRHYIQIENLDEKIIDLTKYEAIDMLERTISDARKIQAQHNIVMERFETATDRRKTLPMTLQLKPKFFSDAHILEPICLEYKSESIDRNVLEKSKIYQAITSFLHKKLGKYVETNNKLHLYVSLSGGVDSMVIAFILSEISRNNGIIFRDFTSYIKDKNSKQKSEIKEVNKILMSHSLDSKQNMEKTTGYEVLVHAIHIDYNNRPESFSEARYVEKWCKLRGIDFFERRIKNIHRGITARDEYEKEARKIRFDAYKACFSAFNGSDFKENPTYGVMFGHHKDDIIENVISNLMKGCNIMEISGMKLESTIDMVHVWRPLLNLKKKEIINFAHQFNIPYMKDTTPKWSTRGKLRDKLLPLISSTYGEGFRHNISTMACQSDELYSFLLHHTFTPFYDKIIYGKLGFIIPLDNYMDYPFFFYKLIFRHLCHSFGNNAIKDRAISAFLEILKSRCWQHEDKGKLFWITLKHDQPSFIMLNNGMVFLVILKRIITELTIEEKEKIKISIHKPPLMIGSFFVQLYEEKNHHNKYNTRFNIIDFIKTGELSYLIHYDTPQFFSICTNAGKGLPFFKGVDRKLRLCIPIIVHTCKVQKKINNLYNVVVSIKYFN